MDLRSEKIAAMPRLERTRRVACMQIPGLEVFVNQELVAPEHQQI